jgi:endonuclease YncB( thermonuclease family)
VATIRKHLNFLQRILIRGKTLQVTKNVELELIANGWARVLDHYSPDDIYFDALDYAKRHRLGLWASAA